MHIIPRPAGQHERPPCTSLLTFNVHRVHSHAMDEIAKTPLDSWMSDNDKDDVWLASALCCSRSQASRIRRGKSTPSPTRAFQIEKLTRSKVKASALLTAATPVQADQAA